MFPLARPAKLPWFLGERQFATVQDAARRMAEEKAALEAKVFVLQPRTPVQPHTVPRPFSLTSPEAQVCADSHGGVLSTFQCH